MEQIAKELVALMKQRDEIESLYNAKRDERYNALTNAVLSTFECNGLPIPEN